MRNQKHYFCFSVCWGTEISHFTFKCVFSHYQQSMKGNHKEQTLKCVSGGSNFNNECTNWGQMFLLGLKIVMSTCEETYVCIWSIKIWYGFSGHVSHTLPYHLTSSSFIGTFISAAYRVIHQTSLPQACKICMYYSLEMHNGKSMAITGAIALI